MITVFTPAYNRADLLHVAYDSLCRQTVIHGGVSPFEWLIVDDGSTDNTEDVVKVFCQEGKIPVRYFRKPNGGKHTAINYGAQRAFGELFMILDSDDSLPSDAIDIVLSQYENVRDRKDLAGVCGLMAHHDGQRIGSGFPSDGMYLNSIEMRYRYNVTGDLMEVWRTDVLKEFPFPEYDGERFCPEALVWNRIAGKYRLHCFNKIVYYRDYLDDGLTANIMRVRHNSPLASMNMYSELAHLDIPFVQKLKASVNFWRFTPCKYCRKVFEMNMLNIISFTMAPFGVLMRLNDIRTL